MFKHIEQLHNEGDFPNKVIGHEHLHRPQMMSILYPHNEPQ